jgi:hypothetical protein
MLTDEDSDSNYTNGMAWPFITGATETVMTPGMRIKATSGVDQMQIGAGKGYERSYTWDGETRSVTLWPRKERWYGSLGIYYPGSGNHWKPNHGVTRGVLEEGILWFDSEKSAMNFLQHVQPLQHCVYTHDGLVVAWQKVTGRNQLNVDVWQFMILGKKPIGLPGSSDDKIETVRIDYGTQDTNKK